MDTLALSGARDFALTTDALAFMQAAAGMMERFSALAGDNYILSGCAVTGSSASSGMVVIGGRLMPFSGGSIQEWVRVITTTQTITVDAGSYTKTTYSAAFGASTITTENIAWSVLNANRMDDLVALTRKVETNRSAIESMGESISAEISSVNDKRKPLFVGTIEEDGTLTVRYSQIGEVTVTKAQDQSGTYSLMFQDIGATDYIVSPTPDNVETLFGPVLFGVVWKERTLVMIQTFRLNEGSGIPQYSNSRFSVTIDRPWR